MAEFILDKKIALKQYDIVRKLGKVSYSVKTNPECTPILEQNTDAWFSIHTIEEMVHVKDLSRVLFLAFGWDEEELKALLAKGVDKIVVENQKDLDVFLKVAKNGTIFLRMKLRENSIHTGKYYVFGFGSSEVNEAIKSIPSQFVVGVHVHRKTQNLNEWELISEFEQSLSEDTLKRIKMVCVGGGLPSQYKNISDSTIQDVLAKIGDVGLWLKKRNIELLSEPGRFICAPAIKLAAKVKQIIGKTIIVDCSVYNASMDTMLLGLKLLVDGEGEGEEYTIKGCTPCSLDIFRYKVALKKVGSVITFLNAGAYNFKTDFCDMPKIPTRII